MAIILLTLFFLEVIGMLLLMYITALACPKNTPLPVFSFIPCPLQTPMVYLLPLLFLIVFPLLTTLFIYFYLRPKKN